MTVWGGTQQGTTICGAHRAGHFGRASPQSSASMGLDLTPANLTTYSILPECVHYWGDNVQTSWLRVNELTEDCVLLLMG